MADKKPKLDPTQIDFWITEARKLKHAADLCWDADLDLKHNSENARLFGLDKALIEAADDAELELNWLYPNLIAFAIQHLAIGILLKRNPRRLADEGHKFQIIKTIQDCGVAIDAELYEIFSDVEHAFQWGEKSPQWSVHLSSQQVQSLKRRKARGGAVTPRQRKAFDALFNELDTMAKQEMPTGSM